MPNVDSGAAADAPPTDPWFRHRTRGYLLDFQLPDSSDQGVIGQPRYLQNIDPGKIVAQLVDAGVEVLYVHAKDNQGNCYYDTAVGHKHSDIGDRDLMAEFSRECRARGIVVVYYVQLSRERRSFEVDQHKARREDGSAVETVDDSPGLPSNFQRPVVCLNGPHREYIVAIVKELAERYDFDGFWFDCFSWWGNVECCYCDTCRMKYREDSGRDLPVGPRNDSDAWRAYLRWRERLNVQIWREITDAARSANPRLTITHNGGPDAKWAAPEFFDADDYVSGEFHYIHGLGNLSLQCRRRLAVKPGEPFEVELWRFFNNPGTETRRGYQVRPLEMHLVEMSTVLAHGGIVQYYDQVDLDGSLDARSIDVMSSAFSAMKAREPRLRDTTPVEYAAVMCSHTTDVYAAEEARKLHRIGLEGAHHALVEAHVPLALLTDRHVSGRDFGAARVVVVPSVACLSDAQVQALDEFVRAGGGLVVTHRTSLADDHGRSRENFALADVLGVDYVEPSSYRYSLFQTEVDHPVTDGLPSQWPMTVWNMPQAKILARDATTLGRMVNPSRGFHMGYPPMEVTPFPAITAREVDSGRVVYFSAPIDAIYGRYGHPDYRNLLLNAVRWAGREAPPVEVFGPLGLEVVARVNDTGSQLIVHLLNRVTTGSACTKGSVVQEIVPIPNVTVRVNDTVDYQAAVLEPHGIELSTQKFPENGYMEITVPEVGFYDMLVLDR